MVIVRNGSICLSVLLLWSYHLPLSMSDEINQRWQPHSLKVCCMRSPYCLRKTTRVLALRYKGHQTSTLTRRTHIKLQPETPRTDATNNLLLHVWAYSVPGYAELLFWKHEGDMVTVIMVSRKYFSGEEGKKKK